MMKRFFFEFITSHKKLRTTMKYYILHIFFLVSYPALFYLKIKLTTHHMTSHPQLNRKIGLLLQILHIAHLKNS